jgi:hypothetical protein
MTIPTPIAPWPHQLGQEPEAPEAKSGEPSSPAEEPAEHKEQ